MMAPPGEVSRTFRAQEAVAGDCRHASNCDRISGRAWMKTRTGVAPGRDEARVSPLPIFAQQFRAGYLPAWRTAEAGTACRGSQQQESHR
jgi:hypothetical protein